MERKIDNIIKESINKFILNERLSSVLYHFTGIGGLYHILKSDSFKLKSSYGRMSDDMHKTKKFYLSCTRQRSGLLGYSRNLNVRISLDGDLLNQNYEGGAVDYWGTSMGKQSYYDKEKYNKVDYFQPSTENEDRIFSEFPIIKHASRYIKRVDILLKNKDNKIRLNYMYHILRSKFNKIIYIYDNENDFNYQTNNIINSEIFDSSSSYDSIPNDMRFSNSISYGLSHMLSFFVLVDGRYKDYKEYSAKLLKKYGLDDYISKVLNGINIHMNIDNIDSTILDGIRTNDGGDVYEKSFLMLRDFLRNHGFSNINDAIKFVKKRNENRYGGIYDEEKVVNVFAFTPNGNNDDDMSNIIILHPDRTLFWDIEQFKYNKKYFINDIERNIRSHKSGSDEKFHKYLQHMVKGKITVSDMLSFLSRLDTEEEDIIEYLFGGSFRNINVKFYRIKYYEYANETDKEELREMFRD